MAQLSEFLGRAAARALVIEGPPGIGKTAL